MLATGKRVDALRLTVLVPSSMVVTDRLGIKALPHSSTFDVRMLLYVHQARQSDCLKRRVEQVQMDTQAMYQHHWGS